MSQLTAVDISDSNRFELADVLKEESEWIRDLNAQSLPNAR